MGGNGASRDILEVPPPDGPADRPARPAREIEDADDHLLLHLLTAINHLLAILIERMNGDDQGAPETVPTTRDIQDTGHTMCPPVIMHQMPPVHQVHNPVIRPRPQVPQQPNTMSTDPEADNIHKA